MRLSIPAALLIGVLIPGPAEAGMRTFFQPALDGARIDACLGSGICGKPAADAFCRSEGYDKALNFERQSFANTLALDTGKQCAGESCTAFRQVKCVSAKSDLAAVAGTGGNLSN